MPVEQTLTASRTDESRAPFRVDSGQLRSLKTPRFSSQIRACEYLDFCTTGKACKGAMDALRACFRNARWWRFLPVAPTTAFSPFSPVQKADLRRQQRVDLTRSPSRQRMAALCTKRPKAGVDAKLPLTRVEDDPN